MSSQKTTRPLRVAMLVVDDREDPSLGSPALGAAPTALIQGFAELGQDHVEVHVVACLKQSSVPSCTLAANVWYHPLQVPAWAFLRALHLGPAIAVQHFLRKAIQPDIVHSQGIEWWCGVAGAFSNYPSVLTIHGNVRAILRTSILRPQVYWKLQALLGNFAVRRHSGVICISEHVRRDLAPTARRTWLIPNALRKEFLQQRQATLEPRKIPSLLVVGTITENKRPLEILEILFALHSQGAEFEVTFIGRLDGQSDYEQRFALQLDTASRLGFAHHKEHLSAAALAEEMSQAHALIHFPREEAFGLVVAEAISQGLSIFANRVGGLPEVCGNYEQAFLVDSHDLTGLRYAIQHWLKGDPARFARLRSENFNSPYRPLAVAQATLKVYQEVAAATLLGEGPV